MMAALVGAFVLGEGDNLGVDVAEDVDLDVAGMHEVLLDVDVARAEGALGLAAGRVIRALEGVLVPDDTHATAAAARRSLEDHGKADRARHVHGVVDRAYRAVAAGEDGYAGPFGGVAGVRLVAHQPDRFGRRPDELDLALADDLREVRVLRQKAVAGVNGVRPRDLGGGDDGRDVQIA